MAPKVLILGGTTEARLLAGKLAGLDAYDVTLSLAGRTRSPLAQPVPTRLGGFGGAAGLTGYLQENRVDLLVDATHPYAAAISKNAVAAAHAAGIPCLALRRPPWVAAEGDSWIEVADAADAVRALGDAPRRVFLALGRQEIGPFEAAPQHFYLVRSVDAVEPPLAVPDAAYLLGRGPFRESEEEKLLADHRVDRIVCKNSGGAAAFGKIAAARRLGIEVVMIVRPSLPDAPSAPDVPTMLDLIDHVLGPAEKRGV